jgi:chromosomal replication initiator protein
MLMEQIDSSLGEFWDQIAQRLRNRLSTQDFCSWFSGAQLVELTPQAARIEVVNEFAVRWIQGRFAQALADCVADVAGIALEVELIAADAALVAAPAPSAPGELDAAAAVQAAPVAGVSRSDAMTEEQLRAELSVSDAPPSQSLLAHTARAAAAHVSPGGAPVLRRSDADTALIAGVQPLDDRYRFENFVIGPGNQMVHAAALAVAESPARSYNPLFVHGPTGLGKTHLLHAIGHYVRETRPEARVAYVTTEQFLNRFLAIVQAAKTEGGHSARDHFKSYFRDVDVLLMDDVQFLAGRSGFLQEELFHMFNALHANGRQIVLTSDCQPEQIPKLEDRLRSRFAWGLIADIETPDRDTRIAILRRKTMVDGLDVPSEVLELVAEHVTSNVRELEGVLTRVVADASLRSQPITLEAAERVVASIAPGHGEPVTIERIQQAVCDHYELSRDELLSDSRARAVTLPRQIGMYLSRQLVNAPSTQVALRFNRRDHSTILHAEKKIDELIRADHEVHDVVARLTHQLRGADRAHR